MTPRDWTRHPPACTPGYFSSIPRAPRKGLIPLDPDVAALTGPVFGARDIGAMDGDLIRNAAAPGEMAIGPRIVVQGRVLDEGGRGVPGALLEIWQANAGGRYRHVRDGYLAPLDPNFAGAGRVLTGEDGGYHFDTVMPGAYPFPNGPNAWRPAHIHFSVFGRAFAQRLVTQMYFEGDPMIRHCPIAATLPSAEAVAALTARYDPDHDRPMDARAFRFDIVLRGRRETPVEAG